MSSSVSKISPLFIELTSSRYLACLLLLSYGGAGALLFFLPLSVWFVIPLLCLLSFDGYRHWRLSVKRNDPRAIVRLAWYEEDEWSLWRRDGSQMTCQGLRQSVNYPQLVVLNFSTGFNLVLLPDSADREQLRRLRVRLRMEAGHSPESEWSG